MSVLNPRTRRDIELDQVLGIVAGYAASELGKKAILSLAPTSDRAWIEREFQLLEEMLEAVRGGFSPGAISDPPPRGVRRGAVRQLPSRKQTRCLKPCAPHDARQPIASIAHPPDSD